jgi:hypothetical protein
MPLKHAQLICSWVALTGQLNLSSEWLPGLSKDRVDLLKRTMPAHTLKPRPADLLEHDPPRLWLLTDERREPRRDVIGVFNWDSRERDFDYPLERLRLDEGVEYTAFDYWANEPVAPIKGRLKLTILGESCVILAVRPRAVYPQLLSTSRHITQGVVDVTSEAWDAKSRTLSGESQVVGGDPYELRIVLPVGRDWNVAKAGAFSGGEVVKTDYAESMGLVRMTLTSAKRQPVRWSVHFK